MNIYEYKKIVIFSMYLLLERMSHYATQALIFMPQFPQYWGDRCMS